MRKRLRLKKMKQQSKIQSAINVDKIHGLLRQLREFTPENIEFSNGYFFMNFGDNSVGYFSLKETPDWEYGIWLNPEKGTYQVFGDHRLLIDKFKPSRTYLSYTNIDFFRAHVLKISENPKLYFGDAYHSGGLLHHDEWSGFEGKTPEELQLIAENIYDEALQDEKDEQNANERARVYAMNLFQDIANLEHVAEVSISDKSKLWGGFVSPQYDVFIKPTDDATAEQIQHLYETYERMEFELRYEDESRYFCRHDFRYQCMYRSFDKKDQKKITKVFYHTEV